MSRSHASIACTQVQCEKQNPHTRLGLMQHRTSLVFVLRRYLEFYCLAWQRTKRFLSPEISGYVIVHFFAKEEPCSSSK